MSSLAQELAWVREEMDAIHGNEESVRMARLLPIVPYAMRGGWRWKLQEKIDKHLQERMPDLLKEVEREIQKELEVHEWQVVKP